jgi:flagellar biosynthesis protein FlhG
MPKFEGDQAAGLRRIMAKHKPRIVSLLSTSSSQDQQRLMGNLAASMQLHGATVLMVEAIGNLATQHEALITTPSLLEITNVKMDTFYAIQTSQLGLPTIHLTQKNHSALLADGAMSKKINQMFDDVVQQYEIVLVTTALNDKLSLPLTSLNQHEIIIQLTRQPDSIKHAYTLIKQICNQLGTRSFGIIVENASDAQAEIAFLNIAKVAKQFIQVDLEFFGAIPNDVHLGRAAKLGRTVIDAFPLTSATSAFKKIAHRLNDKQTTNRTVRNRQVAFI